MTVAQLRQELRHPTGQFDEREQEIVRILLDSGADPEFVETAAKAFRKLATAEREQAAVSQ